MAEWLKWYFIQVILIKEKKTATIGSSYGSHNFSKRSIVCKQIPFSNENKKFETLFRSCWRNSFLCSKELLTLGSYKKFEKRTLSHRYESWCVVALSHPGYFTMMLFTMMFTKHICLSFCHVFFSFARFILQ